MDVVLGLDCGTTATKAVAAGPDGVVRAVASAGYPLLVPERDHAELDPVGLVAAAVSALRDAAAQVAAAGDRVAAVTLCAALHGLVPLDDGGAPAGPLLTWADGRSARQARELRDAGRAGGLHRRTGTPVHPMSPLVKLAWWRGADPDLLRRTPRWGGVKELVLAALCGGPHRVDLSCASGTGLYDARARRWDPEALDVAGVRPDQLAEVVATTAVAGPLLGEIARATGLPTGTPVVVGAADGPLANLGLGAVREGVAAVSLGTSAALRAVRRDPGVDEAGRLFSYALTDDLWVVGGALSNAGSVVRWAAQAFAAGDPGGTGGDGPGRAGEAADDLDARLLDEASAVAPGAEGLLCLPYLLGERAPWWRPGLRGAYLGLRRDHGRPHLVRAAVEGVCQQVALVGDALADAGVEVREVRATGGAVASPLWVATLAAALDLPVAVADSPEGTGLGAALLGAHALGGLDDLRDAADLVSVRDPVPPDTGTAALLRATRPLVETSTLALAEVLETLGGLAADRSVPERLASAGAATAAAPRRVREP